jgi:hypothetical protein
MALKAAFVFVEKSKVVQITLPQIRYRAFFVTSVDRDLRL